MKLQKGFSLIELLLVVAIILIIAAIAIPALTRSRMAANEASAVASLRTINTAAVAYCSTYPAVGYPPTLGAMKPGAPATSVAADVLDPVLVSGTKSGYSFTFTTDGLSPSLGYSNTGQPILPGQSGQRYFYTDQTGVLRSNGTTPATISDLPL